ncbi:MAG: DUF2513 domain-containing protein [Gemmatimonadota bacterium]
MKRDMDLVRAILFKAEEAPGGSDVGRIEIPGWDEADVLEHIALLKEAGYVEAAVMRSGNTGGVRAAVVQRITWQGHEFLDLARSDTLWSEAKDVATKQAGSASLEVFKAILTALVLRAVGLPG